MTFSFPLPYQGEDVDIVRNGGFEDGLNYWSIWTQSNNWAIDVDGAPIYQSDSTLMFMKVNMH